MTILAISAFSVTFALVAVFFVFFPLLAHGLIGLALGRTVIEHKENVNYIEGHSEE